MLFIHVCLLPREFRSSLCEQYDPTQNLLRLSIASDNYMGFCDAIRTASNVSSSSTNYALLESIAAMLLEELWLVPVFSSHKLTRYSSVWSYYVTFLSTSLDLNLYIL